MQTYPVPQGVGVDDGLLCVKRSEERRPDWGELLDEVAGVQVLGLTNSSSSAVLLFRVDGNVFAFVFGYGRHLLEQAHFVQDFGLRTALNTLDEKSLRSVDLHTLEDQPVQKRSQAARDSEVSVFGIDILRDILRAVTGNPKPGVGLRHVAGGDAMFSFSTEIEAADLPALARRMKIHYDNIDYKTSFAWVDNIRRIKDDASIDVLNAQLLQAIRNSDPTVIVTLPEIGEWDSILGFSFTRRKTELRPTVEAADYLAGVPDLAALTVEGLKRDKLFVHDLDETITPHSVYNCIYYEIVGATKTSIIFAGKWYEIDATFIGRIRSQLDLIPISTLDFPDVHTWVDAGEQVIETEGDYNTRTAGAKGYLLLDKKLVKTDRATTPVELCDLLTQNKQFVHVKHRKGGSAGLSHLFAQGGVAAEIMLGDRAFRTKARTVLRRLNAAAMDLVPLDNFRSSDCEIVFLILGESNATLKDNLPFFSKVNLAKTYENLTQRGFVVSIAGVGVTPRPPAP